MHDLTESQATPESIKAKGTAKSSLKKFVITLVLIALLVASSLGVVFSSHKVRQQFILLSKLETQRDKLESEWTQLLLEESVWGAAARVEQVAKSQLKMKVPSPKEMKVVR